MEITTVLIIIALIAVFAQLRIRRERARQEANEPEIHATEPEEAANRQIKEMEIWVDSSNFAPEVKDLLLSIFSEFPSEEREEILKDKLAFFKEYLDIIQKQLPAKPMIRYSTSNSSSSYSDRPAESRASGSRLASSR